MGLTSDKRSVIALQAVKKQTEIRKMPFANAPITCERCQPKLTVSVSSRRDNEIASKPLKRAMASPAMCQESANIVREFKYNPKTNSMIKNAKFRQSIIKIIKSLPEWILKSPQPQRTVGVGTLSPIRS